MNEQTIHHPMAHRRPQPPQMFASVALRYRHALLGRPGWPAVVGWRGLKNVIAGATENASRDSRRAKGEGTPEERLARCEAVLFLANEPLALRRIAQFASLADATEARTLIRRLNQKYDVAGRAFRVEEVAGGFQMLTRQKFGGWLRRMFETPVQTRLSSPALETLAVIAYRQPVLRVDVEAVRGVQCGEMLRQLMERDLVRIVGRSDDLGRPFLYGTTKRFLQVFGLRRLEELPRAEELRARSPQLAATIEPNSQLAIQPGASRTDEPNSPEESTEELAVSIAVKKETPNYETLDEERLPLPPAPIRADEEEFDYEDDDEDDDDEDEDDDEEEDDDDLDDDFEDDDWEEVDDEELDEDDEEWDEDEDEEDDDDDDDDDWEDDDEEEEEEDEE